jgi:hypothetical protein
MKAKMLKPGDDLEMMQSPQLWGWYPFLPVKRWKDNGMALIAKIAAA